MKLSEIVPYEIAESSDYRDNYVTFLCVVDYDVEAEDIVDDAEAEDIVNDAEIMFDLEEFKKHYQDGSDVNDDLLEIDTSAIEGMRSAEEGNLCIVETKLFKCGHFGAMEECVEWDEDYHEFFAEPKEETEFDFVIYKDGENCGVKIDRHNNCPHCREKAILQAGHGKSAKKDYHLRAEGDLTPDVTVVRCINCGRELMSAEGRTVVRKALEWDKETNKLTLTIYVSDCRKCDGKQEYEYRWRPARVNHGLWAYAKDESDILGLFTRVEQFMEGYKNFQYCATEDTRIVGSFGIAVRKPNVVAAYDNDVWSYAYGDGQRKPDMERALETRGKIHEIKNTSQMNKLAQKTLDEHRYCELICEGGEVEYFWVTADFASGHPHFIEGLLSVAQKYSKPLKVMSRN